MCWEDTIYIFLTSLKFKFLNFEFYVCQVAFGVHPFFNFIGYALPLIVFRFVTSINLTGLPIIWLLVCLTKVNPEKRFTHN